MAVFTFLCSRRGLLERLAFDFRSCRVPFYFVQLCFFRDYEIVEKKHNAIYRKWR